MMLCIVVRVSLITVSLYQLFKNVFACPQIVDFISAIILWEFEVSSIPVVFYTPFYCLNCVHSFGNYNSQLDVGMV